MAAHRRQGEDDLRETIERAEEPRDSRSPSPAWRGRVRRRSRIEDVALSPAASEHERFDPRQTQLRPLSRTQARSSDASHRGLQFIVREPSLNLHPNDLSQCSYPLDDV
jgi:hypothetical protein